MLEVSGLTRRFGGLLAVADASLHVPAGSIVALVGPNGAGKTTLFAMISGFVPSDSGKVVFAGEDVTGLGPHVICARGLVRTFQVVQPFGRLSVRENVAVGTHLRVADRREALARATAVAERVGMGHLLDRPAQALTVAGRKRLELARALATEPRLLLLDEVMAGLNPTEMTEMIRIVRGIRDGGVTVFLIEHVMQAVASLAERVHVLNQGRLIAEGAPAEIARMPEVVEAYLGHGVAERMTAQAAGGAR
ncbi:MAG: ABC transporter ATP-binding protein [Alphaproteobacteria bacterium]|nr:ABC transporter ATP-binding protein [Alphaproteobacteria bacterium]